MKKFFFLFVLGFLTTATIAQTVNVTFRVNMRVQVQKGLFNIATDSVVVRGSFQMDAGEPANWAGGVRMTKGANDTIYSRTATFPVARVGTA
ncbi:MAG: hypothetical protein C0442_09590, partial [Chlorobiaceae bacterium]|nr:hypothetical protein [Chlorobiaceae bacterium]